MPLILIAIVSLLAGCAAPVTALFPPGPAVQAKAYEGLTRPQAEVATLFISDGRPHYESGFICKLNGRPVLADGACVSILYLLAGDYTIGVRYKSPSQIGEGAIRVTAVAGRVYQLNTTSLGLDRPGRVSLIPMTQGAEVTYRKVAPNLFPASMLDKPIPYAVQ
jgi:hypothetical protein